MRFAVTIGLNGSPNLPTVAKKWAADLKVPYLVRPSKGTLEEIESDMIARDHADSSCEIAPLEIAQDAILVDSSELGIEETVNRIYKILQGECNVL